ncbi:hypothetical protein [Actinacidiphila paucisporea]|uniref:Uncharacterized protein n=1 Tax=Actinacidiphila paucisporea TaxID=310782 RepID=A0A1M7PZ91_9ACTN|nr:hypothetical protein [Actinacidiphila paucisporea]SHN23084.1 hypothetical protein SAMN05216499_12773 [Actinacidiphila paucisporea]
MNQPHQPDTELDFLAAEFDAVLHSLRAQDPAAHRLSGPLTAVVDLTARLGSTLHDAHAELAGCAPADRSSLAATATELCHAVGAAGRAVSALAAAQNAHLFIGHFADRYGHPDADTAIARARIAAALTTARDNLTETSGYLRHLTGTDTAGQLLRAARARSRQADGAAMGSAAVSPAESSTPIPPNPARRR